MSELKIKINNTFSPEQKQAIKDAGYQAHYNSLDYVKDNPYPSTALEYWVWREGYIEAVKDTQ